MLSDPQMIKSEFLKILDYSDPLVRQEKTATLLTDLQRSGALQAPGASLPLDAACRLGDLKIVRLFLEHNADITMESAIQELGNAKNCMRKTDSKAAKKIGHVIDLAVKIYEASNIFNQQNHHTGVGFCESLHLACFLKDSREKAYCEKKTHRLPASVFFNRKSAYILYPRKDAKSPHPNILGGGSYKDVYPALKVRIRKREVILAAQMVPSHREKHFDSSVLPLMRRFSKFGKGFPSIFLDEQYFSRKKQGLREIVVQPFWEGCSLKSHTLALRAQSNKPPLSLHKQIRIAACLASAVRKMHRQNLVHGDIKPDNCLYNKQFLACLTDFDLTHVAGKPGWWGRFFYGSIPYIPPEQLDACYVEEGSGQPGDMYALGLVLHELSIGQPVWFAALVSYCTRAKAVIEHYAKQHSNGLLPYDQLVQKIMANLTTSRTRKSVIAQQKALLPVLRQLEAMPQKTLEQRFHLLIYGLLHPDHRERLTADQFYTEIRKLKQEAASLALYPVA